MFEEGGSRCLAGMKLKEKIDTKGKWGDFFYEGYICGGLRDGVYTRGA